MTLEEFNKLKIGDDVYSYLRMTKSVSTYKYLGESCLRKDNGEVIDLNKFLDKSIQLERYTTDKEEIICEHFYQEREELNKNKQNHLRAISKIDEKLKHLEESYSYLIEKYPERFV